MQIKKISDAHDKLINYISTSKATPTIIHAILTKKPKNCWKFHKKLQKIEQILQHFCLLYPWLQYSKSPQIYLQNSNLISAPSVAYSVLLYVCLSFSTSSIKPSFFPMKLLIKKNHKTVSDSNSCQFFQKICQKFPSHRDLRKREKK